MSPLSNFGTTVYTLYISHKTKDWHNCKVYVVSLDTLEAPHQRSGVAAASRCWRLLIPGLPLSHLHLLLTFQHLRLLWWDLCHLNLLPPDFFIASGKNRGSFRELHFRHVLYEEISHALEKYLFLSTDFTAGSNHQLRYRLREHRLLAGCIPLSLSVHIFNHRTICNSILIIWK